jgi:hypothetical protein
VRRLDDGAEEQETLPGVVVLREPEDRFAQRTVAAELLGALNQPVVEPPFDGPQRGGQLGVIARRVGDQITGVDLEEAREQEPRVVREMRAGAAFNLREVGLAERFAEFLPDGGRHFLLAHLASEAAEVALDGSQRPDFLAQRHCNSQYTYCRLRCQTAHHCTRAGRHTRTRP